MERAESRHRDIDRPDNAPLPRYVAFIANTRAGHVKHVFTREESCARDGGALEIFPIGLSARRRAAPRRVAAPRYGN